MANRANKSSRHLLKKTEKIFLHNDTLDNETLSAAEQQQILHKILAHQLELETENEKLRHLQSDLEISRTRYLDLYNLAPVGYMTLNKDGVIKEANLTLAKLLGVERVDLLKKPISQFILAEDQETYSLHQKRLFDIGVIDDWQMRLLKGDQSPIWVRLLATQAKGDEYWISLIDITERKEAENALRMSEKDANCKSNLLTTLLENLSIGVVMVEALSGKTLLSNEAAVKLLGKEGLPDAIRQNLSKIFHGSHSARSKSRHATELPITKRNIGHPASIDEIKIEKDDGTEVLLGVSGTPVRDDQGQIGAFIITFFDMTEQKQSERLLQARLRISEYAISHSLDELLTKTLAEAEGLTNSQVSFFYFVSEDQSSLTMKKWSNNALSILNRAKETEQNSPLEKVDVWLDCLRKRRPIIHNDVASLFERKIVVPIFRNKQIVGIMGVGNKSSHYTHQDTRALQNLANLTWDIVTRKKMEEELHRSETKYSRLFESMTDAYACVDMEGRIIESNSSYQQLTGYSQNELSSLTYHQLTPDKWHAIESEIVKEQILPRGYSDLFQKEYRRKDGSIIDVEVKAFLLKDQDDQPAGMWAILRDISDRRRAEEELRQAKMAAEAANTAKSQFLANMSHEIRTPMNGVIGLTELLLATELTDEQREYARLVKSSGKTLLELISNILDLSKIEAHRFELESINFNLHTEINDTIQLYTLSAREKGLELISLIDPDVPHLLNGDPVRLRQILTNLIANAIKFTEDGSILLHISKEHEDEEKTTLHFIVSDTGIGIAAEKLESIFAPFTQADGSTTRRHGGTGLGLSIARQLATLMGGEVGVKSTEMEGTTFWFTAVFQKFIDQRRVPRYDGSSIIKAVTPLPRDERADQVRLLLAEDDLTNQVMTKAMLNKFGYQVDVAKNGYEALKLLEENDYEIVLMDCMMPLLNGYDATAVIRNPASAVKNHSIPVIALTANAMQEDRDRCLAAGMDDYLSKPIEVAKVLSMLDRWLVAISPEKKRDRGRSNSTAAIFDREEFVKRSLDDLEISRSVAKVFITAAPEYLESIRIALDTDDMLALQKSAHKLKGSAATIALPLLTKTAGLIEKAAETGDLKRSILLFPELLTHYDDALEALREHLNSPEKIGTNKP